MKNPRQAPTPNLRDDRFLSITVNSQKYQSLIYILHFTSVLQYQMKTEQKEIIKHTRNKALKMKLQCESQNEYEQDEAIFQNIEQLLSGLETEQNLERNSHLRNHTENSIKPKRLESNIIEQRQINETLNKLKIRSEKIKTNRKKNSQRFQAHFNRLRQQQLCKNIKLKLGRNNVYREAPKDEHLEKFEKKHPFKGIKVPQCFKVYADCFNILVTLIFILAVTMLLSFHDVNAHLPHGGREETQDCYFQLFLVYFFCQMLSNFLFVRKEDRKLEFSLQEYARHYLRTGFAWDFLVVAVILLKLLSDDAFTFELLILLAIPTKIPEFLKRVNRVQRRIMTNIAYQKYASIVKIVLFNFAFAHFVAVCLNLMASLDPERNWQVTRGIHEKWWFERYVWSYYWATTIMLTIGFGDITPSTYQEALCVVFIEIVSCLAFSYNISCLGSILAALQEKAEHVDNNRKLFNFIASKNSFSRSLVEKIENFIEDEAELKEKFCVEEELAFVGNLPQGYRTELTCESNISTLRCLPFFGELIKKSIYRLSEHMVKHIYTPEEVVRAPASPFAVSILQSGAVSYFCNEKGRRFRGVPINRVTRTEREKPFLMDLEIVTLRKHGYSIKSLVYSIVHRLQLDDFVRILQGIPKDYEYYCYLRDQSKHKVDEYETVDCPDCKSKHTYFDCPKYHFMPLHSQVIAKYIRRQKQEINLRNNTFSRNKPKYFPLKSRTSSFSSFSLSATSIPWIHQHKTAKQLYTQLINHQPKPTQQTEANNYELIMSQLIKLAQSQAEILHQDEIWEIKIDALQNYDLYFPYGNLKEIMKKQSSPRQSAKLKTTV